MPDEALAGALRRIIREEVGPRFDEVESRLDAVGEQLGSLESRFEALEKRVADGFAWTEEQFEWVGQRFDTIAEELGKLDQKFTERFDRLERILEGVIDENFPPIDQQRSGGPPASTLAMAAKGER